MTSFRDQIDADIIDVQKSHADYKNGLISYKQAMVHVAFYSQVERRLRIKIAEMAYSQAVLRSGFTMSEPIVISGTDLKIVGS